MYAQDVYVPTRLFARYSFILKVRLGVFTPSRFVLSKVFSILEENLLRKGIIHDVRHVFSVNDILISVK